MPKNGWEFLERARRRDVKFVHACIRIDDGFGEVPVEDLQSWLEKMEFFTDPHDPEWVGDMTPGRREFSFQIWSEDGRLWFIDGNDGLAVLAWLPATPEAWLREKMMSYETELRELTNG